MSDPRRTDDATENIAATIGRHFFAPREFPEGLIFCKFLR